MKRFGIAVCTLLFLCSTMFAQDLGVRGQQYEIRNGRKILVVGDQCPRCPNPKCTCKCCKCPKPCKCGQSEQNLESQTSEMPKSFVDRAYASTARLTHSRSGGSATVVDCYKNRKGEWVAVLIGCYHVVDYKGVETQAELFWPAEIKTRGYVVEVDPDNDLSLMSMRVPNQVPYVFVSTGSNPKQGTRVLTIGCPALDVKQSTPVGYFTTVMSETYRSQNGIDEFSLNWPAVGGHSGGGVFYDNSLVGVLVSRGNGQSQAVNTKAVRGIYDKVFCESEQKTCFHRNSEQGTCLRCIFGGRRQPRPPYQGPEGGAPDLRPEEPSPPPVVPQVPQQEPVPEPPVVEDNSVSPVAAGLLIGFPAGLGALAVVFTRKVKASI